MLGLVRWFFLPPPAYTVSPPETAHIEAMSQTTAAARGSTPPVHVPGTSSTNSKDRSDSSGSFRYTGQFQRLSYPDYNFRRYVREATFDKHSHEPEGYDYTGNMCYRNAVILMLMTSDVFMKFVIRHVQLIADAQDASDPWPEGINSHQDLLTELKRVSDDYWPNVDLKQRKKAMGKFWRYVKRIKPAGWQHIDNLGEEQDAEEFLTWILATTKDQFAQEVDLVA